MLDSERLVELYGLWNEVGVEFVEIIIKECREILRQILRLLKAGPESVSKCSDIWYVLVLTDLRLFLNVIFELSIIVSIEQPLEYRLLNLLIVFLFEEVIVEKLDRSQYEKFSFLCTRVKRSYWPVGWKADWST